MNALLRSCEQPVGLPALQGGSASVLTREGGAGISTSGACRRAFANLVNKALRVDLRTAPAVGSERPVRKLERDKEIPAEPDAEDDEAVDQAA